MLIKKNEQHKLKLFERFSYHWYIKSQNKLYVEHY